MTTSWLGIQAVDPTDLGATRPKQFDLLAVSVERIRQHGGLHRTHTDANVVREGLYIGPFPDFVSHM